METVQISNFGYTNLSISDIVIVGGRRSSVGRSVGRARARSGNRLRATGESAGATAASERDGLSFHTGVGPRALVRLL